MGSAPSAQCSQLQLGCHLHRGLTVRCDRLQKPETSKGVRLESCGEDGCGLSWAQTPAWLALSSHSELLSLQQEWDSLCSASLQCCVHMALSQLLLVTLSCISLLPAAQKLLLLAQNSAHECLHPVGSGPKAGCGYKTEERMLLGGSHQQLWFPIPKPSQQPGQQPVVTQPWDSSLQGG